MNSLCAICIGAALGLAETSALAIPTPVEHLHSADSVHWQQPGSPPLSWDAGTANRWNHNHLTNDPFVNLPHWVINKAWDGRTLHNGLDGAPPQAFGHGLIPVDQAVRYGWGASFADAAARDAVERAYDLWQGAALNAFTLLAQPDDRLAMAFERVDTGPREVTFNFVAGLGAYGMAYGAGPQFIDFELNPTITLDTGRDDIAVNAHFGRTQRIDAGSALAVAIDYSYAVPAPPTLALVAWALVATGGLRRWRLAGLRLTPAIRA